MEEDKILEYFVCDMAKHVIPFFKKCTIPFKDMDKLGTIEFDLPPQYKVEGK